MIVVLSVPLAIGLAAMFWVGGGLVMFVVGGILIRRCEARWRSTVGRRLFP